MALTNWSFEQQRAGNSTSSARRICVEIGREGFCMPIKGQSKTTKKRTCPLIHKNYTNWKKTWTDVEPSEYSLSDYAVSKKLIHRLRHGKQVHREDDGAIEFWRIKDDRQKCFLHCHHWSDDKWKKSMGGGGGGNKKRYQYCTDSSGAILYL